MHWGGDPGRQPVPESPHHRLRSATPKSRSRVARISQLERNGIGVLSGVAQRGKDAEGGGPSELRSVRHPTPGPLPFSNGGKVHPIQTPSLGLERDPAPTSVDPTVGGVLTTESVFVLFLRNENGTGFRGSPSRCASGGASGGPKRFLRGLLRCSRRSRFVWCFGLRLGGTRTGDGARPRSAHRQFCLILRERCSSAKASAALGL